jgi:exosome complex exonuclease DIS3/RRP44
VERLAFSAIWEMTPEAEVLSMRFTKSVIASRAALTYAEAQTRIDDERLHDEVTLSEQCGCARQCLSLSGAP